MVANPSKFQLMFLSKFKNMTQSKIKTWDSGPGILRPETLGPWGPGHWNSRLWDPGLWNPVTRNPDTQDPGTGNLTSSTPKLGPWNLGIARLRPRILRTGPSESNLWHRFLVFRPAPQIKSTLIVNQILIIKS